MSEKYKNVNADYQAGVEHERKRILKLLSESGFIVALELREGDPAIWDGKKWVEITERKQR